MSSAGATQSLSSLTGTNSSTSPPTSLKFGDKPCTSSYSLKTDTSCQSSSSVSSSRNNGSHAKPISLPIPASSTLGSSSLASLNGKLRSATTAVRAAKQDKKSNPKKGCISGMNLDFHYQNLLTTPGRGRSRIGTGGGMPTGCDLMWSIAGQQHSSEVKITQVVLNLESFRPWPRLDHALYDHIFFISLHLSYRLYSTGQGAHFNSSAKESLPFSVFHLL